MPRTRSLAWAELKIGILAVFAIVMTAVLIFAVGNTGGFFWQRYPLKVVFDNVAGVKEGSPVRLAGREVGAVSRVTFVPTGVEVTVEITRDVRELVTDRSIASVGTVSLLGEGAVDITPGAGGTPLEDNAYLPSGTAEGSIAAVTAEATLGMAEIRRLVEDLRAGRGTVGRLFSDDTFYKEMVSFVQAAEDVTRALGGSEGTLGRLINEPELYDELRASLTDLNAITVKIREGEGSLGRLLHDPALADSLAGTAASIERITGRIERGEGTMGKLLTDEALHASMTSTADRLDRLTAQLQAGEGTAGRLLQDTQLYENMNLALAELRSLLDDIRRDPRKFLNVKVSLF
jgi:phospholipid/cholesterol/gamma-HCH transport system substrate-binding protein